MTGRLLTARHKGISKVWKCRLVSQSLPPPRLPATPYPSKLGKPKRWQATALHIFYPSFFFSMAMTAGGLALPLLCFMT
jgi:hypothetical protein